MRKIISIILIITIISSAVNIAFAADISNVEDILSYGFVPDEAIIGFEAAQAPEYESCMPHKTDILHEYVSDEESEIATFSSSDFIFNSNLLTKFNTITAPESQNGVNNPKFSYNTFLEENISEYSGDLTLNFEDITLDGRNGLDLRIGRTYQSAASTIAEKSLIILPYSNEELGYTLINKHSTYLLDRYNLGMGWGFNFPSVQVETEYIPEQTTSGSTFHYIEEKELYYHAGNGEVYHVDFTDDETDSNFEDYYAKDIQFNKNDIAYSNGQVTSYYSLTTADKTKQYFANDGRLLGIVDRFGNEIKFEHTMTNITSQVPECNFYYDDEMWSANNSFTVASFGRYDNFSMLLQDAGSYIVSQPIQVKPSTTYNIGLSVYSEYGETPIVEVYGYDTAYNPKEPREYVSDNSIVGEWNDWTTSFTTSTAERYVIIKISSPNSSAHIDNVILEEPKPLITKITDTIGRTVEISYDGELYSNESGGTVTLTVNSPDKSDSKTFIYTKESVEYKTYYAGHEEQRKYWYLSSSELKDSDRNSTYYVYGGGAELDENGELVYPTLYMSYDSKYHYSSDYAFNAPLLNIVQYNDRIKMYEYETVRKHLGDDGYYDTQRVTKKYDEYGFVDENNKVYYTGQLNTVEYSYSGDYNGFSFDNETGYPNFVIADDSAPGDVWTVTKTGKSTDSTSFSKHKMINKSSSSDGVTVSADYTYHETFENSPIQIKNTITENNSTKETYTLYSYNDWGGLSSETKEVTEQIKNDSALLEKYTTHYNYDDTFHQIIEKSYYNDINGTEIKEIYTYDSNGLLTSSENAVSEKTNYYYENTTYPFLATKLVQDDPMHFHNLMGKDSVIIYTYDDYGLYPTTITKQYDEGNSQTQYVYDYISGDVLREILADGSYTDYSYYIDGRVKQIISPLGLYLDDRSFYTIELHTYTQNVICSDYEETYSPVYTLERITCYRAFTDSTTAYAYDGYLNFYDAVGNLKISKKIDYSKKDDDGNYLVYNTKYYHDTYDRLIETVDNEGHTILYSYDGFDRPISVTDSENNVYSYQYDTVNNKIDLCFNGNSKASDRLLLTQKYDDYGNLIEQIASPDNSSENTISELYEYDLSNNLISYTDPNGNKTEYSYDNAKRLTETKMPNGVTAKSSYSSFDTPAFEKIFDKDGIEKSSRISCRNEKGDLKMKFSSFDKRLVDSNSYSSDAKGRTTQIAEGENTYSVVYDEMDHPIATISGSSQIQRRYGWLGEVASGSEDGVISETRYGYEGQGNVAQKLQDNVYLTSYNYSSIGNITDSTMPSKRIENYTYTANGNLDTIASDGNTFDYDYYDTGYIKSITYPNGLKTSYEYDNINRITKVATTKDTTTINTFEYEYDNNGNTTKEIRNGAVTLYSYDSLDRLISVTYSDNSTVSYEYDALNNRTKEIYSNGDIKDYVYNEKYQLKEIKLNGIVTDTYKYNATGAVLTHNNETYTYNEWDKLSEYSDGTNTYTYKYDVNGIRTQKNDKQYIIDINNNVIAETDSTGAITDEILWGHQPLARKINGNWYYYIYNAHGDVVGLVNDAGTVVNTYEYTPWGEIHSETETVDNPIKYAGEYYDDELDMIYLRARYYDAKTGRFTSLDIEEGEISSPLDMNRYVYCRNNPIKYLDPTGEGVLLACIIIGAVVGAVAGGFAGAYVSKKTTGSVSGTSIAIGVLGGATIGGLLGWGSYALGASISATGLVTSFSGIYKTLEQGVNFASKALQHMNEKARQVPVQVLIEAIKYGTKSPDPQGSSAMMYTIEMVKNGKTYTLEVLYNAVTNTIWHFLYK